MKQCKTLALLLAAVLAAAPLAGCAGEAPEDTAGPSRTESLPEEEAAPEEEPAPAETPTGDTAPETAPEEEPTAEEEAAPAGTPAESTAPVGSVDGQTAYGSGRWYLYAERDGAAFPDSQELQFQDGALALHFYSLNDYGKGGYGEGCSDPLEFSPYAASTPEEAAAALEAEGYTVTIQQ